MDHAHYDYSAMPFRQKGLLPPGLHLFVVVVLEHWDFQSPKDSVRDPRFVGEFGSFNPDYRSWSQREYGLRIGVFRLIESLKAHGIRPGVAANALVLPRVPTAISALQALRAEWIGHGIAATRMVHSRMPIDEQRQHIHESLAAFQTALGAMPQTWLSQDWGTTPDTWRLLGEAGIRCTLDWGNDDQPYWMNPTHEACEPLLALPLSSEWDDVQAQWLRQLEPREHAGLIRNAALRMHAESLRSGQGVVMGLSLHPWVWGMPSRIAALRQLLDELHQMEGVHWRSPNELLAQCVRAREDS